MSTIQISSGMMVLTSLNCLRIRYDSFFRDFNDFVQAQTDPMRLEVLKEFYDSTLEMFSSFTTFKKIKKKSSFLVHNPKQKKIFYNKI